jgi:tetratricopeptide (TPR) repeat protein
MTIPTVAPAPPTSSGGIDTVSRTASEPHARFGGPAEPLELSPDVLRLLDDLDRQAARADVALQTVARTLTAHATDPDFFYQLGRTLQQRGRHDEAAQHYRRAIQIRPQFAAAYVALASVERSRGRSDASIDALRQIVELCPRDAALRDELAAALEASGRLEEAAGHLRCVAEADPSLARAWFRLGGVLARQGQTRDARECFARGLGGQAADGETRFVRSLVALQLGEFSTGWRDFDLRYDLSGSKPPVAAAPPVVWDERLLARQTVLVRSEGNLADDLMFASCLHELAAATRRCLVECDARLSAIFARSFAGLEVGSGPLSADGIDGPTHKPDAEIPLGSLPRYLRPSLRSFPGRRGYLRPDADRRQYWRDRLRAIGPGLKVGISWRCNTAAKHAADRSAPLEGWAEVLRVPGVQFVSLQADCAAEIAKMRGVSRAPIHEVLPSGCRELDDLAALIAALDLVIAAPNLVSHLAGALGAEAWVPLPTWPSWRWMLEGDSCPWYPGMRLFRQKRCGAWDEVLADIAGHLRNAETAQCTGR